MTKSQSWLVLGASLLLATLFAYHFVNFLDDELDLRYGPALVILNSRAEQGFGTDSIGMPNVYVHVTGLYANYDNSADVAFLCGLVLPVLLISGATFLFFAKRPRIST
jgi:hypothetical protein